VEIRLTTHEPSVREVCGTNKAVLLACFSTSHNKPLACTIHI
jgi:hypothetical protein